MAFQHLEIGGLANIRSWGWSNRQMADEINGFRAQSIAGLNELCFIENEFFGELLAENHHTWRIIFDSPGNILGFWQYIPLTPAAYRRSEEGEICGSRIIRPIVPQMVTGNSYDVYFFSLSICSTIRKSLAVIRFSASIIDSLVDLARQEIFINNMSMCFASSYTQMMNKFFLQFEYCGEHVASGKIHRTHFPSFLGSKRIAISMGRNMRELIRLYKKSHPPLAASA